MREEMAVSDVERVDADGSRVTLPTLLGAVSAAVLTIDLQATVH
jgi:hypothetical protein